MRRRLAAFLAASDADAIVVTPEALRWLAVHMCLVGGFVAWCWIVSLIA